MWQLRGRYPNRGYPKIFDDKTVRTACLVKTNSILPTVLACSTACFHNGCHSIKVFSAQCLCRYLATWAAGVWNTCALVLAYTTLTCTNPFNLFFVTATTQSACAEWQSESERSQVGEEARKLFDEAQTMLSDFIKDKPVTLHAIVGIYPANAVGDDIEIYTDDERNEVKCTMFGLRQQQEKEGTGAEPCAASSAFLGSYSLFSGLNIPISTRQFAVQVVPQLFTCSLIGELRCHKVVCSFAYPRLCAAHSGQHTMFQRVPARHHCIFSVLAECACCICRHFCMSDFIAPKESGLKDYLGMFVNTAGLGLDELTAKFKADQVRFETHFAVPHVDLLLISTG